MLNIFIYNSNRTISTRRCSIDLGNLLDSLSTINYCTEILNLLKDLSFAQDTENADMEDLFLRPIFKTVIQDLFMSKFYDSG